MSGAYLTRGPYGGLVRGCACKMPLNADMSCPRCGPRVVGKPLAELLAPLDCNTEVSIEPRRDTCSLCGYTVHAPNCPTQRREIVWDGYRDKPCCGRCTGKWSMLQHLGGYRCLECGLLYPAREVEQARANRQQEIARAAAIAPAGWTYDAKQDRYTATVRTMGGHVDLEVKREDDYEGQEQWSFWLPGENLKPENRSLTSIERACEAATLAALQMGEQRARDALSTPNSVMRGGKSAHALAFAVEAARAGKSCLYVVATVERLNQAAHGLEWHHGFSTAVRGRCWDACPQIGEGRVTVVVASDPHELRGRAHAVIDDSVTRGAWRELGLRPLPGQCAECFAVPGQQHAGTCGAAQASALPRMGVPRPRFECNAAAAAAIIAAGAPLTAEQRRELLAQISASDPENSAMGDDTQT